MDDIDRKMAAHVETTMKLADEILDSVGADAHDAILKAAGTLAQVIFIAVHDHDPPAGLEHVVDGRGHGRRVGRHLVMAARLARLGQGVATERDDGDLRHGILLARVQW